MHLRQAQPELPRQRQKEMVGVGPLGGAPRGRRAGRRLVEGVVEIAGQIIERQCPAIALIAHEPEQHARRTGLLGRRPRQCQLECRQRLRRIRKPGALDEKAAHLDFRMRPGLQPPIELQQRVILIQHGAVRLLGIQAARDKPLRQRRLGKQRGRAEPQFPRRAGGVAKRHAPLALDCLEQRQSKAVSRHRVDECPFAARLAQLGQGRRLQILPQLAARRSPHGSERQQIQLRLVIRELRLNDGDQIAARVAAAVFRRRRGDLAIGQQPCRFELPVLCREPALPRQKARDHVAFELRQVVPAGQIRPAMRHDQGDEFGMARLRHIADITFRRWHLEPEEAVRRQGQLVGLLADRQEHAAPQHLDDLPAAEFGEIERDRLGRARQVGDAQDRLVLPLAQIGNDLAVRWVEEP